jgi:hypothetical protein
MFSWMYDKALTWARHRHAKRSLFGLSFTESVMFPFCHYILERSCQSISLSCRLYVMGGRKMQQKLGEIVDCLGGRTVALAGLLNVIYG